MRTHFFSFFRHSARRTTCGKRCSQQSASLPLIEIPIDPIDQIDGSPHLYRHSDATPIELFFDLFFVANLSTFTATHEIYNVEALVSYIGFLGVIWFTWLQVTLFDIRFARDSVFERACKAVQLAVMVAFASAGTRFTPRMREENVWAFKSLTTFLGGSRILLGIQYTVNIFLVRDRMKPAARGMTAIAATLFASSLVYLGMLFILTEPGQVRSHIWTVWFVLFGLEMWIVMGVSCSTSEIGLENTHLNVRMGLLTLIIIGEGVIAVTRIVTKTVRPVGWTRWSFVHILGVTTKVYFVWQAYFDLSPRGILGKWSQQIWAQLHFPFHIALILLLEGSQILALTLNMTLKLADLTDTIVFACEDPRPASEIAIGLLRNTISDMEINYSHGAINEQAAIEEILGKLFGLPLCPEDDPGRYPVTRGLLGDLVGNVTAALFTSMGLVPTEDVDIGQMSSSQLLRMYIGLLGFVYQYFFVVASIVMFLFASFVLLGRRHTSYTALAIGASFRVVLGVVLASLVSFVQDFILAYSFMTSPVILYAFTFMLLTVLLVDRLLDHYEVQTEAEV